MAQFALIFGRRGPVAEATVRAVGRAMPNQTEVIRVRPNLAVFLSWDSGWEPPPRHSTDDETGMFVVSYQKDAGRATPTPEALLDDDFSGAEGLGWPYVAGAWSSQRVRVLCDPLGHRAAWWGQTRTDVVVASLPTVLLAHPDFPKRPNLGVIAERLTFRPMSKYETVYEGMSLIPPGHTLTIAESQPGFSPRLHEWHRWDQTVAPDARRRDVASQFLELTDKVVSEMVAALDPRSCVLQLSGGLDSSALAGVLAKRGYDDGLVASCQTFPGLPADERAYQEAVLANRRFEADWLPMIRYDFERDTLGPILRSGLPRQRSEPAQVLGSRSYARRGRHTEITGQGGDEIFAEPDGSFAALVATKDWERARQRLLTSSPRRIVAGHLHLMPLAIQRRRRVPRAWVTNGFATETDLQARMSPVRDRLGVDGVWRQRLRWIGGDGGHAIRNELTEFDLLETATEAVSPFFEPRLVELSLRTPSCLSATVDDERALQRMAFDPVLPPAIRERRGKVHSGHRHTRDLLDSGQAIDVLKNLSLARDGLVDPQAVVDSLEMLAESYHGSKRLLPLAEPLWTIIGTELWWRQL